ncbi:MAG: ORF6N domain-containing protein [Bacilli bacterium]|nr:ORF6N domain-containing protein [Bacilli bacterium]
MPSKIVLLEKEKIENLIYEVRGQMVMLASDVARLYNSEVRIINQVVKRNLKRFPENFCFQLTKIEYENLKSQFVISNNNKSIRGGNRFLPYAFTEHGVMMLSGLLKSDIAAEVNISIRNFINNLDDIIKSI